MPIFCVCFYIYNISIYIFYNSNFRKHKNPVDGIICTPSLIWVAYHTSRILFYWFYQTDLVYDILNQFSFPGGWGCSCLQGVEFLHNYITPIVLLCFLNITWAWILPSSVTTQCVDPIQIGKLENIRLTLIKTANTAAIFHSSFPVVDFLENIWSCKNSFSRHVSN